MDIASQSRRIPFQSLAALLLLAGGIGAANRLFAAEPRTVWLTGKDLRNQLDLPAAVLWSSQGGLSFRQALVQLSQAQRVAIVLDRRVDPDQKVELSADEPSLDALLKVIARKMKIGIGWVGPVCYFGPEATARRIRTVAALRKDEAMQLPKAARTELLKPQWWRWADLAAPRDLLAGLAAGSHIEIQAEDRIPHDLWAAGDLPALTFIDRLTLLAAQFDLTFEIGEDGTSVKLVDMPETAELSRSYPLRGAQAARTGEIVSKLTRALPEAQIEANSGKLAVRGRAEDQDFVQSFLSGEPAKKVTVTDGKKVYRLTIVMAVGPLIKKLGEQMKLDVRIDEPAITAAGLSLDTKVNVRVKDVSADELLKAVLEPAGLKFERKDKVILVGPAKK